MGKSKTAAKTQVPECRYGSACTRKDCIFRHPPKKERQPVPQQEKSDKVCFAFVAGRCAFGKFCHDRHPDQASCDTIRARYSNIDCQWGRGCRMEGCLYRHPSATPVGPSMPLQPPKPQPAVFAGGPTIAPTQPAQAAPGRIAVLQVPKAIVQAADLRDASASSVPDPLERFLAVNARNTGIQSASLLDLHLQTAQTFGPVLDDVLPERLRMFQQQGGVWLVGTRSSSAAAASADAGPGFSPAPRQHGGDLFHAVREYLVRQRYDFAIGQDEAFQQVAFLVKGRRKRQDPVEGVRAVMLCGLPGSGKTTIAEALARKSAGRFLRIGQADFVSDQAMAEAFRGAVAESCAAADEARDRARSGSWWWDHAFHHERFFLALCLRGTTLAHLSECFGATPSASEYFHAVIAYLPTGLDLQRSLGRPHRIAFKAHLVLEATAGPNAGELVEAILCSARVVGGESLGARPVAVYIAPTAPPWAARHLQVLTAVPLEKRIMTNSTVGSFKVRRATDLSTRAERSALCLLVHKAGESKGAPVGVSFDAACLLSNSPGKAPSQARGLEWTPLADAALGSLNEVIAFEDPQGAKTRDWASLARSRCVQLGFLAPELRPLLPSGPADSTLERWTRLRPKRCLMHCAAQEADVAQILRSGAAVLRKDGRAMLPVHSEVQALPSVVVVDAYNGGRNERGQLISQAGLQKSQVIAVHLDVTEAECAARVANRSSGGGATHEASAAAALVRRQAERFETPAEREGFRAIVRLKGVVASAQELVRRWTEDGQPAQEGPGEGGGQAPRLVDHTAPMAPDEAEEEAPPPPLPQLSQWIEVEEQSGQRSVWGGPLAPFVDPPLGGFLGDSTAAHGHPGVVGAGFLGADAALGAGASPAATFGGPWGGPLAGLQDRQPLPSDAAARLWGAAPDEAALRRTGAPAPQPADEDDEESARQEQLAATLRCMGFDEEPSHFAARSAGGNLNVAIESVLRNSGAG